MAKISGPLFSFGASGTVGKVLTFNQSDRRAVARKKPAASTSATPMQLTMRADFVAAAKAWRALDSVDRAAWIALAAPTARPAFAKYYLEWAAQRSTAASPPQIPMK